MSAWRWVGAHVAVMLGIHMLDGFLDDRLSGCLLYGFPLAIGMVQLAFLHADLRWLSLLWLPACIAGLFLSFFGIWWFLLLLGAGLGIAQAPLLAMSGYRRSWIWVAASGLGWLIGMIVGSFVSQSFPRAMGGEHTHVIMLHAVTALVYAASTAAALHLMPTPDRCPVGFTWQPIRCRQDHGDRPHLQ